MQILNIGVFAMRPNDINYNCMKSIFKSKVYSKVRPNEAMLRRFKTVRYGEKSLNLFFYKYKI